MVNNGNYFEEEKVIIQKPNVIEITIPQPKAEGKKRPKPIATLKEERFVF